MGGETMAGKKDWYRKTTQACWEDLRAWVEQLYSKHGVLCAFTVQVPVDKAGINAGVSLDAWKAGPKGTRQAVCHAWQLIDATVCGSASAAALHLVSRLLLEMDEEVARAERDGGPLWL
jgi:hypothetical protein